MLQVESYHRDLAKLLDTDSDFFQISSKPADYICWNRRKGELVYGEAGVGQLNRWQAASGEAVLDSMPIDAACIAYDSCRRLLVCGEISRGLVRYQQQEPTFFDKECDREPVEPVAMAVHTNDVIYLAAEHGIFYAAPDSNVIHAALRDETVSPLCIGLAADEQAFYLSDAVTGSVLSYRFSHDGTLVYRITFAFPSDFEGGPCTGIAADPFGHVYCASPKGVHIYDNGGLHLGLWSVPVPVRCLCFGANDERTLFAGGKNGVYGVMIGR